RLDEHAQSYPLASTPSPSVTKRQMVRRNRWGQNWTPITPPEGSIFHAETQSDDKVEVVVPETKHMLQSKSTLESKSNAPAYGAVSCPRRPHQREVGSQNRILLDMLYPIRMLNLPRDETKHQHLLRH
ncbi:hypothetical protein, partial [Agrobacterium fabrum]|uniref:hypothetical protein n=1 Tax=Agrobacterium fabrum TaxID=1176649 RepID=UPI00247365DC